MATARQLAPNLPLIVRAATQTGIDRLLQLGAQDVIHPELEGGLAIVRHTLLRLGYTDDEVDVHTDRLRHEHSHTELSGSLEPATL